MMNIDLSKYSLILVNTSSGKDSVNCLMETVLEARRQRVLHRVMAVYSDLGADWTQKL